MYKQEKEDSELVWEKLTQSTILIYFFNIVHVWHANKMIDSQIKLLDLQI